MRVNVETGEWVVLSRINGGHQVPYHKHHGGLNLYVLDGELNFIDEDWIAGSGSYVYEPPGNTHVELSEKGVLLLAWSQGPIEFLNADNTSAEIRDCIIWHNEIEEYHARYDIPMPPSPGYFF